MSNTRSVLTALKIIALCPFILWVQYFLDAVKEVCSVPLKTDLREWIFLFSTNWKHQQEKIVLPIVYI
jgi:hypothetical protein